MEPAKRILLTVTNDLTYDQRMQKVCRSLAQAGYDVELIGRKRDISMPISIEPYRQTRLKCFFNKGKFFYLEYNLRLLFHLASMNFDAICAVDLDTVMPVSIIGRLKGAKLIFDAHEYFSETPEVVRRPLIKKIWEWIDRTFVPGFDLIYTVSPGLANIFSTRYGQPVHVILNVPLLEEKEKKESAHRPATLIYQGTLNEGRGLEQMIEAMKSIDAKLLLAGEGDLSEELRQLVREQNLEQKVEFTGWLLPDHLAKVTETADIGIHVSLNKGLSYYHSLGNKFFNYIHAGLPQVCTTYPEYQKINEQYNVALLIQDDSPDEIVKAVQRLQDNPDLFVRLKRNCETCSRVYNWQEESTKLLNHYAALFR
ncbi:MAG: glycosyltransferase family 4 protein [Bacteroidetes bacterium]|nr:glycosyltransferase family 4 protein [Bacteroidota bacterium]